MKETSTGIVTRKGAENLHRIHNALQIWNRPDTCGRGSLSIGQAYGNDLIQCDSTGPPEVL